MSDDYICQKCANDPYWPSDEPTVFCDLMETFGKVVNQLANKNGFWDESSHGEKIALMHSELSEALENVREGFQPDKHLPEFKGVEVEMADTVIRIMDYCAQHGYRLGEAILAKHKYNTTREHKHGKAF